MRRRTWIATGLAIAATGYGIAGATGATLPADISTTPSVSFVEVSDDDAIAMKQQADTIQASSFASLAEETAHSAAYPLAGGAVLELGDVEEDPALTTDPSVAAGGDHVKGYKRSYRVSQNSYSKRLGVCFRSFVRGSISFTAVEIARGKIYAPRLNDPELSVTVTRNCSKTGTAKVAASKADLTQAWYDSQCDAGLQVGAGYPWGVSVGVAPSCQRVELARRATYPDGPSKSFSQYNSGKDVVKWPDMSAPLGGSLCPEVSATVTVYKGSRSDTQTFDKPTCVKR